MGVIGVANRGAANLAGVAGENVVALCDVDEPYLAAAAEAFPRARTHVDFRRMLDAERLDAVVISTPDHTHAPAALAALDLGLDVYCEKPLTHSVLEARRVARRAEETGAVTQLGTQVHAGENYRRVVELVESGAIGPVRTCHAWVGKAWGGGVRPVDEPPIPAGLHYDLWLGPAPYRPYHPAYLPAQWRRWWDFGGGTLGDMGCHLIDLAFWALSLRWPQAVAADGPPQSEETAPESLHARWEFPARRSGTGDELPPVVLHWYDGGRLPQPMAEGTIPERGMGVLFEGDRGSLFADYGGHALYPEEAFVDFVPPDPWIPPSVGHHAEWIEACKSRGPTSCPFSYGGPLTETVLLGNVAYRSGASFRWDAQALRASDEAAQRLLARDWRAGWELRS